jgi:hypothetical protein
MWFSTADAESMTLERFADQMKQQKGWEIARTTEWGGGTAAPGEIASCTVSVRTKSLQSTAG